MMGLKVGGIHRPRDPHQKDQEVNPLVTGRILMRIVAPSFIEGGVRSGKYGNATEALPRRLFFNLTGSEKCVMILDPFFLWREHEATTDLFRGFFTGISFFLCHGPKWNKNRGIEDI
jgi:hypothetical protein